jgi:hypothetical protein
MPEVVRSLSWPAANHAGTELLAMREWLVTNGLGGYAAGAPSGVLTRRYHGLLIAALPAPLGRIVMLSQVHDQLRFPDGTTVLLSGEGRTARLPVAFWRVSYHTWARPASTPSARSSMPNLPSYPEAVWPRPGASPKCCAAG